MADFPDHFRWLATVGGAQAIDYAALADRNPEPTLQRVWQGLTPEQRRLAAEQANLRQRAREKFSAADRLLLTRVGLEQATDELIARYKAARFPAGRLADLCAGIGGDLMALAQRGGEVVGVDRDEVCAFAAQHNADQVAAGVARVDVGEVAQFDPQSVAAWHLDPDRRAGGQRTTHAEAFSPGPAEIERLRAGCPQGAVKLAPATEPLAEWREQAECEWISRGRECRQLVAWFGELGTPGTRRATLTGPLDGRPQAHSLVADERECQTCQEQGTAVGELGRFIFEPDPAVLAARLAPVLAARLSLAPVAPGIAYLTGDAAPADSALLSGFEVLDVLPFDRKQLRAYFRERGVGTLEIKKRGVDAPPDTLRRELKLAGKNTATLILTPVGPARPRVAALVVRRLVSA